MCITIQPFSSSIQVAGRHFPIFDFFCLYVGFGLGGCIVVEIVIPLLILVVENFFVHGDCSDARNFRNMRLHGYLLELCGRHSFNHDTAVHACIKRWNYWGKCGAVECATILFEICKRLVSSFELGRYECKLSARIALLVVKNAHLVVQDRGALSNPSIELKMFCSLFDDLGFCRAQGH